MRFCSTPAVCCGANVQGIRRLGVDSASAAAASPTRPTMCRVYTLITLCEIGEQVCAFGLLFASPYRNMLSVAAAAAVAVMHAVHSQYLYCV